MFEVLMTAVLRTPLVLSHPVTLYVQVPPVWFRWDKPNPVFQLLMQTGRFIVDVPLIAHFNPHRFLWTSYMNIEQKPPMIACEGKRPFREN